MSSDSLQVILLIQTPTGVGVLYIPNRYLIGITG